MDIQKVRKSMRMSAIAVVITAGTIINVSKNSHVRAVEFISILACGIAIGTLITNLSVLIFLKKKSIQNTDIQS